MHPLQEKATVNIDSCVWPVISTSRLDREVKNTKKIVNDNLEFTIPKFEKNILKLFLLLVNIYDRINVVIVTLCSLRENNVLVKM